MIAWAWIGCASETTEAPEAPIGELPPLTSPGPMPAPPPRPGDPAPAVSEANCDDLTDGGPVAGPDCLTGTLACGQTVAGHTKGGVDRFDTRFYEAHYCTPATTDHSSGDERVYLLTLPDGDHRATVWLDTPCADLDLAAFRAPPEQCPTLESGARQCEMSVAPRTQRDRVEFVSQGPSTWFVVVEGKGDAEGAFSLTVTCADGL